MAWRRRCGEEFRRLWRMDPGHSGWHATEVEAWPQKVARRMDLCTEIDFS